MKAREARKNQVNTVIKEMKLRPKIDPHDYETKKGHVVRFLKQGDKVKITIMFRGREQSRPELGYRLLQRLAADVEELGFVESAPEAGRPQHDHGPRPAQEEGRGPGREAQADRAPTRRAGRAGAGRAARRTGSDGGRSGRAEHRGTGRRTAGLSTICTTAPSLPATAGSASPQHDSATARATTEENGAMPKKKTHSGTKKRFQVTGTGKVLREQANRRHLLEDKSSTPHPPAGAPTS